jgi:hypothetical protein
MVSAAPTKVRKTIDQTLFHPKQQTRNHSTPRTPYWMLLLLVNERPSAFGSLVHIKPRLRLDFGSA